MYTIFAHTADAGIRVESPDLNTLFADAARGLFSLIVANPDEVALRTRREFRIDCHDLEYLLIDWLNELLFAFEAQHLLFRQFEVTVNRQGLSAMACGECVDETRHQLDHEVKAITYHDLFVRQEEERWIAQVIVDI